ncbi:MAG: aminopeptidase, partial [Bacillota bacterium]|nr:aminopeptidase [Bacillota bacterium]
MTIDKQRVLHYLENLVSIGSPSGYTQKVIDYIKDELSKMGIPYCITNKGALIVTFDGREANYQRTFSAHV